MQYVLNGGGTPIGVVSSPEKVALLNDLGVEAVIDRRAAGYKFWSDEHTQDESEWRRFGKDIRGLVGRRARDRLRAPGAPDHGGLGVRLQAGRHHRDLRRHLGLHDRVRQPPPLDEAQDHQGLALRQLPRGLGGQPLICEGKVLPPLSAVYPLDEVGEAAYQVHHNLHEGKIGVLCLAPEEGLGIDDPDAAPAGRRGPHHPVPEARGMSDSMLTEIDHVAIAVNDLEAAIAWYHEVFGATVAHRERVESDGVEEALLAVADSYVQLLTPIRDDSPVAKYLANKGEGLHHIGYRVADCAAALQSVKDAGGPGHRRGAPPGLAGHDGGLRPPQDLVRHADRARPGVGAAPGEARAALVPVSRLLAPERHQRLGPPGSPKNRARVWLKRSGFSIGTTWEAPGTTANCPFSTVRENSSAWATVM